MATNRLDPWKVLKSKELFSAAPWFTLSAQQVRLPDGRLIDDYYQIRLPEYVIVFAQTGCGKVIVERQYKHGIGKVSLTLPAGTIEDGELPVAAAQRELMEETGYASKDWRSLGSFVPHGNFGCGKAHIFVARDAHRVTEPNSGDLEEMQIILMRPADLLESIRTGDVASLGTAATIAMATNPLIC
jgi:ADP-ribose pyrophosphatase